MVDDIETARLGAKQVYKETRLPSIIELEETMGHCVVTAWVCLFL